MKPLWTLVALLLAPLAAVAGPMGYDEARLLLGRAGFGGTQQQVSEYAALSRQQAVERLLAGARAIPETPAPEWVNDPIERPGKLKDLSDEERRAFQRALFEKSVELRGWWMREMIVTPSPLTERMTLFWHNHFVSSQQKVKSPQLMYRQNLLLRRHALGNFGDLLHAAAKDPAMIIYLDSAANRRGEPNENFARELMELFTVGEGRYTETDVKEAARAFTGWSLERDTFEFRFRPFLHDSGPKTVLGRTGNLGGDQVLDILLAQPSTAEFVVTKLWREFVSPTPDPAQIKPIARAFRESGYDIKTVLRHLLTSETLYTPANPARLVKSPVDLIVGTLRQLELATGDALPFALAARQLGQDLFAPPNVKGWPGGEAWINATTLLGRRQFIERLLRAAEPRPEISERELASEVGVSKSAFSAGADGADGMRGRPGRAMLDVRFDANAWLAGVGSGVPGTAERLLLATAPATPIPADALGMELIRRIARDPVYQLK
jgi:uncharacterized protein (DUF1800 family)